MNVNGIGARYPAAGYETRRTERNVAGRNFAEQAADAAQATATLHGAEEGSGDIARRTLMRQIPCIKSRHGINRGT